MFNIGPLEFVVLAAVALIVFGPDKLPQLTKDAARMIKTLRDLAQGARTQLTDELGPGFSDLAKLNPRTAIREALLGDDEDFSGLNPREVIQRAMRGEEDPVKPPIEAETLRADAAKVNTLKADHPMAAQAAAAMAPTPPAPSFGRPVMTKTATSPEMPLREGEPAPFDPDTT